MTDETRTFSNVTEIAAHFKAPMSLESMARLQLTKLRTARKSPADNLAPYRAMDVFGDYANRRWLRVHLSMGAVDLFDYEQIELVYSTGPDKLALLFNRTGILFVRGENVRALLPNFEDQIISGIYVFDPRLHTPPAEGEAVLTWIEWNAYGRLRTNE